MTNTCLVDISTDFLGARRECPEAWHEASPCYFVDARTAPMLILHDPDDDIVPYDQSVSFAAMLMAAGRTVEFMPVPGAGHGFFYNPSDRWTPPVISAALDWFNRFLRED